MKKTYLENLTTTIHHEEHRFRKLTSYSAPRHNRLKVLRKLYLFQDRVDCNQPCFINHKVPSYYGKRRQSLYLKKLNQK